MITLRGRPEKKIAEGKILGKEEVGKEVEKASSVLRSRKEGGREGKGAVQ